MMGLMGASKGWSRQHIGSRLAIRKLWMTRQWHPMKETVKLIGRSVLEDSVLSNYSSHDAPTWLVQHDEYIVPTLRASASHQCHLAHRRLVCGQSCVFPATASTSGTHSHSSALETNGRLRCCPHPYRAGRPRPRWCLVVLNTGST